MGSRERLPGRRFDSDQAGDDTPAGTVTSSRRFILVLLAAVAVAVLIGGSLLTSRAADRQSPTEVAATAAQSQSSAVPELAATDAELPTLNTPPGKTHAAMGKDAVPTESTAKVTFAPYGSGPSGMLVVNVTAAESGDDSEGSVTMAKMLTSQNLLLRPGASVDPSIMRGGEYIGTISLLEEDDRLTLVLEKAERKQ